MADDIPKDLAVVLCDICTKDDRKPAKKTCMKCEMSMCVQHVQDHLTTPFLLQTHPLTEPMALCGTSKCPLHGKLLEYYCLDDLMCVCVSCAIEDQHRLHNMKTFSSAHKELMEKLSAERQALLVKTDDDNVSLEKWEKSQREKLGRSSVRLIEAVSSLRDIALTSVESSVSARMASIKTSKSSVQAAQSEEDTFRFLQMYSEVKENVEKAKAVDLRKGLEPSSHRDKLVEDLRQGGEKMVEQAEKFWWSLMTHIAPEKTMALFKSSSDLIFEPQILDPAMSLSQDNRKIFHNSWLGPYNATLEIRNVQESVCVCQWVVNLSNDCDWVIGLCDKLSLNNFRNGPHCGLSCSDGQVSFLTTKSSDGFSSKSSTFKYQQNVVSRKREDGHLGVPRPETLEVCWNDADSSLAFFSRLGRHKREEIIAIKIGISSWHPVPFIHLETKDMVSPSSSAATVGSFVSRKYGQRQHKCSCGNVYTETRYGYNDGTSMYKNSFCSICHGARVGSFCITRMLCELL